jgi:hypothetical protein
VTNDEVQKYHAGLFAFDPIWRIDEWRAAMLADPNHTRKFSKQDAIPIAEQFLSARGSIVSLKEPCLGCAVIKTFVKIGVGIGHTATGGKFLRRGTSLYRPKQRTDYRAFLKTYAQRTRDEIQAEVRKGFALFPDTYTDLDSTTTNIVEVWNFPPPEDVFLRRTSPDNAKKIED